MTKGFNGIKRSIAVIVVLCMILTLVPINSYALETSDISNHWAKDKIQNWMDQGLIKGYQDGTFRPDNNITRAEFMSLVNGAFGFSESVEINYSDVDAKAWYSTPIAAAKAAAYISGYPDNTIRPNNPISRAEAASIIMKINDLEAGISSADKFTDESSFGWSKGAVNAVAAVNIVNGYPDGSFRPQEYIKRAEAVAALDKALDYSIKNITYSKTGTYGPSEGVSETEGNVNIAEKDIILQNTIIKGNLIIGKNVGDGTVTLKNVTVKGETKIYGGGQNSIIIIDSTLGEVTVSKEDNKIRIVVSGKTTIELLKANSGVKLEENNLAKGSAGFQEIVLDASENDEIILAGAFDKATVQSKGLKVQMLKGTAIDSLTLNEKARVMGTGTIYTVYVNASGVTFETAPKRMIMAKDVIPPEIGDNSGGGGGNGGGSDESSPVIAVGVSGPYVVGQVLTAKPTPEDATVTYQWMRSDSNGETFSNINGATNKTYILTSEDSNKYIKVKITGTGSYTGSRESSAQLVARPQVATPVITLSKTTAANREAGVTFTVETVADVTYYYTLDGTTPTASSAAYPGAAVPLTAPDQNEAATITINAIGIRAGATDSQLATAAVTYTARQIEAPRVIFAPPTAKGTGTYYPSQGFSIEMVNRMARALWGTESVTFNTTWGAIEINPIFSVSDNGSRLTINADNITQSLLDWSEHDLAATGNIAIGINFNGGRSTTGSDSNIISGSEGTSLYRLYVDYDDWEGTTARVNMHNLVLGTNSGGIRTTDGEIASFEIVTIGNLTPVSAVTITNSETTITGDDGELQMNAEVLPANAYDKTIRWSVTNGTGAAAISNTGHGTTGRLYALKNGTVQVYATSADTGVMSNPFTVTISGQVGPPAPADIGKTDETYAGANDGTLTGVAPGQEYQLIGAGSWSPIEGTSVTGLAPGSYWVRIAETPTAPAGLTTAALTIKPGPEVTEPELTESTVTRDPGNTGGSGVTFDETTVTFTGTIDYYPVAEGFPPVPGNYVGVQITAPSGVTVDRENATFTYTNATGTRTLTGAWLDGDNYVYYYPLVTEADQDFEIVVDWDGSGTAYDPETIVIKVAGATLNPAPAVLEETEPIDTESADPEQ